MTPVLAESREFWPNAVLKLKMIIQVDSNRTTYHHSRDGQLDVLADNARHFNGQSNHSRNALLTIAMSLTGQKRLLPPPQPANGKQLAPFARDSDFLTFVQTVKSIMLREAIH
jgi:hypothetical protein